MDFFHKLNQRLAEIAKPEKLDESVGSTSGFLEGSTGDYSAKKARAGKDIGKPGKMFSKIAKLAGERYGSKERGEKVAGAVLAKLRAKESVQEAASGDNIEKVLNAVAQIYYTQYDGGDEIWDADWMQDWANTLMKANPTDKELDFIIANGHMPKRLANVEFPVGDDFQFGESALQAYLGKKKYGDAGMKALQKAGREGASKEKMARIRAKHDKMDEADVEEGNKFTGNLMKARAAGLKKADLDGDGDMETVREAGKPMTPKQKSFAKLAPPTNKITFADKIAGAKKEVDEMLGDVAAEAIKSAIKKKEPRSKGTAFDPEVAKSMFSAEKGKTRTGHEVKDTGYSKRYTKPLADEPEADDEKSDAPKKKGRPAGTKRAIGAKGPTGKSKLMSKGAIKETGVEEDYDKDEYDEEGEMAKSQARTIADAAKELHAMVGDNENLPEWVQKKINLAKEYIDAARDYLKANRPNDEVVAEKAVSKAQRKAAGIAHAAQKGEIPKSELRGASKEMAKMPKGELKKFAKTKEKGLPEKVKSKKEESVEETSEAPKEKKSSGGFQFGKGVYESLDKKYRQALTEGMNVSVNMNTGPDGEPTKNITISADGEDAEALAALLKMAGIGHKEDACPSCGKAPCGCEEELDENSPDWPTNTETSDDAMQYSGGLNGPKSTGQTTVPVIASQLRRQVSMEESVELERSLFRLYQNYKAQ